MLQCILIHQSLDLNVLLRNRTNGRLNQAIYHFVGPHIKIHARSLAVRSTISTGPNANHLCYRV
jgi:hypothetical protein